LASFQPVDAPWFFGRERLTAQVVGRLAEQLTGARPLALVGVSGDGTLRLWPADGTATGPPSPARRYPGVIDGLAYAPDGTLAVAVHDGTVHLRDPDGEDRTIIHFTGNDSPDNVQFSPDGSLLAVAVGASSPSAVTSHGSVIVWDVRRGRERRRLDTGTGTQDPFALAFSPDGDRLVAATYEAPLDEERFTFHEQSVIRMWRTDDLSMLGSYSAGQNQVVSLAASPDGATLAVAGPTGCSRAGQPGADGPVRAHRLRSRSGRASRAS
jgi:WD40 repeat protein